ncbi:enolase-phosphatase E1-like [Impatiens glandulifera]|uniref:enolase-phosphatase E1-like n=1 Tax=Impatiens glandulifera TaxID=253017 RepID=UPI001FB0D467|nr:enolase-phosphatase E1-like [Impatiens glandulifera]
MEVPVSSKEREIEEFSTESLIVLSKASRVFNMGLQLGRNIMITSLFVSSVPLVLPPLLMVSALGFAFSVPIGVLFASYTCTEKIMSKLLPVPGLLPDSVDSVIEAEERYQCEDSIQLLDLEHVAEIEEEEEKEEETSAIDDDIWISEEGDMSEYLEVNDEVTIDGVPEEEEMPVDQVCQLVVDIERDEKYGTTVIVVEETIATFGGQVSLEEEGDMNIKEDDFSRETTNLLERFRDEDNNTEKPVTEMKGAERRVGEIHEKENESNKELNVAELSYLSNGNTPETVGYGSVDVTDKDSVKNVDNGTPEASAGGLQTSGADEKPETKLDRIDTQVSSKDATTEEQQQEEEKIWKQMNALREIIGYKGGGETYGSCVDELKALFVLTGVEPPASFNEQAPLALADVNDSLQFLKSVVGVK